MAGAAQYLQELPSRGFFSSSQQTPAQQGGLRVYVCDHDTAPPEEQLIKTDTTNILIRYLTLKKGRVDQNGKEKRKSPTEEGKGKRQAERPCDDKFMIKRVNVTGGSSGSRREGGTSRYSDKELQSFTVQKIKALLKERGQPLKGNKDELIGRLKRIL
ncbi:hypothetical protein R1flu_005920 [Riccia fluitans]|uniref:SAP domain-containing protein n=1 Tax=Riccia fluitans TaxID=41844 RepID=A0ABD1YUJ1_9MARC